jgi:hypothetical protein
MSASTRPSRVAHRVLFAILLALAPALSVAEDRSLPAPLPVARAPDASALVAGEKPFTLRLGAAEGGGDGSSGEVRYRLRSPLDDPGFTARTAPVVGKNTAVALGEVLLVNVVMWQGSYWMGKEYAKISTDSIAQNFSKGWIIDTDGFWTNQFGHPYEGALFYDAARSTGHGPYESFGVSFLGSLFWESFMETQSPSVNDQVTTPFGGSVFGEVLHRMYRLIIDSAGPRPSGWRKLGAFVVSPVAGVNQFLFGERYHGPTLLPPSWMAVPSGCDRRVRTLHGGARNRPLTNVRRINRQPHPRPRLRRPRSLCASVLLRKSPPRHAIRGSSGRRSVRVLR